MIIIPAIDLLHGKIVRLEKGNFKKVNFYDYTIDKLTTLYSKYNIKRVHIVDLEGAKSGNISNISLFAKIKNSIKCSLQVGGGIRSLETVEKIWENGLSPIEDKIMLGSLPFFNPKEFLKIVKKYGSSILLTVDVFGEIIKISGWQKSTSKNLFSYIQEMYDLGIVNFLVTQIKRDGMLSGVDIELYKKITKKFPFINLIASGGLSSIEEIKTLKMLKMFGVILGKAFYEKKITLEELNKNGFIISEA